MNNDSMNNASRNNASATNASATVSAEPGTNDGRTPYVRPRGIRRLLLAALAAAALVVGSAVPAMAAAPSLPAPTGADGWIRVAHLSPDTKAVDVKLAALKGGASVFELTDVAYGMVSDYVLVPEGTYVVSMVPSGTKSTAKPMVSASVRIEKDKTVTVAAFGNNKDLQTRVFKDDLTPPAAGQSNIRLIQASTVTDEVSVQTSTGLLIASDAKAGESTTYASVPAGPWDLELSGKGIADMSSVDLPMGSVNTLFVLDNSSGGLTVMPVLDSAAVGAAPVGGVQTGGGALATSFAKGYAGPLEKR